MTTAVTRNEPNSGGRRIRRPARAAPRQLRKLRCRVRRLEEKLHGSQKRAQCAEKEARAAVAEAEKASRQAAHDRQFRMTPADKAKLSGVIAQFEAFEREFSPVR